MSLAERSLTLTPMPRTVVQVGVAESLPDHLRDLGHQRAFLVADPGVVAAGLVAPVLSALHEAGIEHATFDGVDPNPTDANVDAGLAALRGFGPAPVVLIGGGSAMDLGKYLALAAPNSGGGTDFAFAPTLGADDRIDFASLAPRSFVVEAPLPTIAIPTTAGTASETNGGGLITETATQRKLTFNHDGVLPQVVLLDPTLTVGLPPGATAACGMDALTHAIEALSSTNNNPLSDGLALQAIRMVCTYLPIAVEEPANIEARTQMLVAAHLAGRAFSQGPLLGLVHATGHPISAILHQPHGQTLATMLPHVMRFNAEVVAERYGWAAQAMGVGSDAAAAIAGVKALSARVGTDRTLRDLGGDVGLIASLVDQALSDLIILTTPRMPSRAEVTELYEVALGGG
jgi:alcohol dehydrogenase class IV